MGEGPKDLRDDAARDPRTRNETIAGPLGDDITGRPLTGLDRPGGSEALGYAGGAALATPSQSDAASRDTEGTAEIRAEIEQTRANISETVDAIQQKLSPSNMVAQATDATRERMRRVTRAAGDAATRVADTTRQASGRAASAARENPWATAAAVAGVGALAWWLMSRRSDVDEFGVDEFDDEDATFDDLSEESLYYEDDFETGERNRLMQTVRGNTVPLVVAGAGLAWWLWSRQSRGGDHDTRDYEEYDRSWSETEGYGAEAGGYRSFGSNRDWSESASNTADRVKESASHAADRVKGAVSSAADRARGAMSGAGERARHVVGDVKNRTRSMANRASSEVSQVSRRAGSQLSYWMEHNPLAVGAAAMALGVAVGMALPESRPERRLMGGARDRLLDRAQSMAGEAVDRAKQTVREVASKATEAMNQSDTTSSGQPAGGGLGQNPR
jgi:ElaB/YqjD/DUF883 family membrane-anchored ribosome-binding protein